MTSRLGGWFSSRGLGFAFDGSFSGLAQEAEGQDIPWYVWLLIILVLLAFGLLVYFWWMRSREEEERERMVRPPAQQAVHLPEAKLTAPASAVEEMPYTVISESEATTVALEAEAEPSLSKSAQIEAAEAVQRSELTLGLTASKAQGASARPDDLKLIEGIGPKIASILNSAGILTFAQLAAIDPAQILEILGRADPRLLKLADPTTWPQQAGLAALGDMEGLLRLQGSLKGGRRAS